jgi:hypothetical protein
MSSDTSDEILAQLAERILGPTKDVNDQVLGSSRRVLEMGANRMYVIDTYYVQKGEPIAPVISLTPGARVEIVRILSGLDDGDYSFVGSNACVIVSVTGGQVSVRAADPPSFGKQGVN